MDAANRIFILVLHGIKDCFSGMFSLKDFLSSKQQDLSHLNTHKLSSKISDHPGSVWGILIQCGVFFGIFWGSNVVFSQFLLKDLLTQFVNILGADINSFYYLPLILHDLFCIGWIFPLLVVSKVLNYIWYQDIADLALKRSGVKKSVTVRLSDYYADQIESFIVQVFYCLQGYSVYIFNLPLPNIVKNLWYLVHLSLLSSLYAFEYKWVQIGWPLHKRLSYVDTKWPYFLGFGLPLAIITNCVPSFIDSIILFATLFPMYVISSAVTLDTPTHSYNHSLRSFKIVHGVADKLVTIFLKGLHR